MEGDILSQSIDKFHPEGSDEITVVQLKIIGKEFPKIVIRRYLERSIQKKFFSNLHSLQIKTIFQEKKLFTVAVYVTSLIGANCECL